MVLIRNSLKSVLMSVTSGKFPENLEYPRGFRFSSLSIPDKNVLSQVEALEY